MIEIRGLSKTVDGKLVLDGVDLDVNRGEIFGVLGPNGAGKTSLFQCVAGLWAPQTGTIRIDGKERFADGDAIRKFTFFLPDRPYANPGETGREHLELIAELYGIEDELAVRQLEDLSSAFELDEVIDQPVSTYSNGQYKKVCIAGAFISNSRLLILDEPFTGEIDPPGMANMKSMLTELCRRHGVTCLLSTQIVPLATELCERIAVLHHGRVKARGTIAEIVAAAGIVEGGLERVLTELVGKNAQAAGLDFVSSVGRGG